MADVVRHFDIIVSAFFKQIPKEIILAMIPVYSYSAPLNVQIEDFKTYNFDEESIPAEFNSSSGSIISLYKNIYKASGSKKNKAFNSSLKWEWSGENSRLTFQNSVAFKNLTGIDPPDIVYKWITATKLSALSFWIYNETPVDEKLWMTLGHKDRVDSRFYLKLNFKGWYRFSALYGRDLPNFPLKDTDTLTFIAPKSIPQGRLLIDNFSPRQEIDVRFVGTTKQTPWVKNLFVTPFSQVIEKNKTFPDTIKLKDKKDLTPQEVAILKKISTSYLSEFKDIQPTADHFKNKEIVDVKKFYIEKYQLHRHQNEIGGKFVQGRSFWPDVAKLVSFYLHLNEKGEDVVVVEKLLIDLIEMWYRESYHNSHFYGLFDTFVPVAKVCKPLMKKHGIWEGYVAALKKATSSQKLYKMKPLADADYFNIYLGGAFGIILLQDNHVKKWKDLQALRHYLDHTSHQGVLYPDGSFHHHNQTYTGYNIPGIRGLVNVLIHLKKDTPFYSHSMHKRAKNALMAMHHYSNPFIPYTFSGRHAQDSSSIQSVSKYFAKLALLGSPDTQEFIDKELASAFIYHIDKYKWTDHSKYIEKFRQKGISPLKSEGHFTLNYSVASIHKRKNWMVVYRGEKQNFLTGESYGNGPTIMSRYLNYGHLEIIHQNKHPSKVNGMGYDVTKGWNWNKVPGTTAIEIPHKLLRSPFTIEERTTDQYFAGGTHLNHNGIFGMILHQVVPGKKNPKRIGPVQYWLGDREYYRRIKDAQFDDSFWARKSVFFFDNRVLCLGSGIRNSKKEYRTITTLFQHSLEKDETNFIHDIKGFNGQDKNFSFELKESGWIIDRNKTGYYIPRKQHIEIAKQFQFLPYHKYAVGAVGHTQTAVGNKSNDKDYEKNEGFNESVIINHGHAPVNAGYEFCLVPNSSEIEMKNFIKRQSSSQPFYRILRQDQSSHIVEDLDNKVIGYVIFDSRQMINQGPIKWVSRPCFIMIQENKRDYTISLVDPYIGESIHAQNNQGVLQTTVEIGLENSNTSLKTTPDDSRIRLKENSLGEKSIIVQCKDMKTIFFEISK